MTRFRRRKEEVKILNNAIQAIQMLESGHLTTDILEPPKRGTESFESDLAKEVKADMMERVKFLLNHCPSEKLDPDAALGRLHPLEEEAMGQDAANALKVAAVPKRGDLVESEVKSVALLQVKKLVKLADVSSIVRSNVDDIRSMRRE